MNHRARCHKMQVDDLGDINIVSHNGIIANYGLLKLWVHGDEKYKIKFIDQKDFMKFKNRPYANS